MHYRVHGPPVKKPCSAQKKHLRRNRGKIKSVGWWVSLQNWGQVQTDWRYRLRTGIPWKKVTQGPGMKRPGKYISQGIKCIKTKFANKNALQQPGKWGFLPLFLLRWSFLVEPNGKGPFEKVSVIDFRAFEVAGSGSWSNDDLQMPMRWL